MSMFFLLYASSGMLLSHAVAPRTIIQCVHTLNNVLFEYKKIILCLESTLFYITYAVLVDMHMVQQRVSYLDMQVTQVHIINL